MLSVCAGLNNLWNCRAPGLSLIKAHTNTTNNVGTRNQIATRGLRRGLRTVDDVVVASLAILAAPPHWGQNREPVGRGVPHLPQDTPLVAGGGPTALTFAACPHF